MELIILVLKSVVDLDIPTLVFTVAQMLIARAIRSGIVIQQLLLEP